MDEDLFSRCSEAAKSRYLSFPDLKREHQVTLEGELEYCAVDLETTGFDPSCDRVIEVAALRVRGGEVVERFESLVNPGMPIPANIKLLTNIDDDTVRKSPVIEEVFDGLREFMGDLTVVAYSRMEERFFRELCQQGGGGRFTNPYVDAMDLAIMLMPSLRSHRQSDLASIWGIEQDGLHRAGRDVETLVAVFEILLNGLYDFSLPLLKALADHAPPGGGLFLLADRVLRERTGGRPVEALKLDEYATADEWVRIPPLAGGQELAVVRREEVRAVFDEEGPLASQFSEFEGRDEQLQMAELVRETFQEGNIILVEAGTGTGKSLAYLVPAVMWARLRQVPVVVSTKTLNLQDQLFTIDLPLLERAMGGTFRYTVLKGYGNYICLRKLQNLINGKRQLAEPQPGILGMLINWLSEGGNGDVSLLNVSHLRGLGQQVLADHRECPGERCAFARSGRCRYRSALFRAKRSHIVVVNHSLLLSGVSLAFDTAVIDEAHTLEDVATEQFTVTVSFADTKRFLEHLYSPVEATGFLSDLLEDIAGHLDGGAEENVEGYIIEAKGFVEQCLEELESTFVELSRLYRGNPQGVQDIRVSGAVRDTPEYLSLAEQAKRLIACIEDLALGISRVQELCSGHGDGSDELEYVRADMAGKVTRLLETRVGLEVFLSEEPSELVRWATVAHPDRFEAQSLMVSPIDVGPSLKESLYDTLDAVVMTSATLTVNGSFDFFSSRVGLDLVDPGRIETAVLDTSFDYERQMQILVLHDLPEPDTEGYRERLARCIREAVVSAGGGALVLFTNRSLMLDVHDALVDDLAREGFPLLCQYPGHSRRRLAEEFIGDERASLFGTSSFWEGVDARGDTLRIVVVTRIPFESPGRPVFEARSERLREMGQSDFAALSLPLAALRLKQGVGRLIRSRSDRGQIIIMDSRIASRQYGKVLMRSLPRARRRNVSVEEMGRAISDFHRRGSA